jgi:hypothetical protein
MAPALRFPVVGIDETEVEAHGASTRPWFRHSLIRRIALALANLGPWAIAGFVDQPGLRYGGGAAVYLVILLAIPGWLIAAALVAMSPPPIPLWVTLPIAEGAAFAVTAYGIGEGGLDVVVIVTVSRLLDAILRYAMRERPEANRNAMFDIP